jgi:hypothetical protein
VGRTLIDALRWLTFVTFDLWSDPHESPFLAELSASDESPLHQALGNLKNLLMR